MGILYKEIDRKEKTMTLFEEAQKKAKLNDRIDCWVCPSCGHAMTDIRYRSTDLDTSDIGCDNCGSPIADFYPRLKPTTD